LALSIRFRRGGRRNRAFFRLVVADSRFPRDGRFIERLGYYDPIPDPEVVEVKVDKLLYWLRKGAKPTKSVKSILSRKGIWSDIVRRLTAEKRESTQVDTAAQSESAS